MTNSIRILVLALVAFTAILWSAAGAADAPRPARRTVYAWFPADLSNWDTRAIDWGAIDFLSIRGVTLHADGHVEVTWGCTELRMKTVVAAAHQHGAKVTINVWGVDRENSSKYLAHCPRKAARSLLDFVLLHDLDGVCLDDETWSKENTETKGPNRDSVTGFLQILRAEFKAARPDYHLCWASPPVIAAGDKFGAAWVDFRAAADCLDAFAVMSYCMLPPTAGWTGGQQPVAGGGKVGTHCRDYTTTIRDYLEATGGRNDKILLGISLVLGGTEWKCRSDQPLSPIYPLIEKPRRITAEQARANAATHGRRFDPQQQEPWYCYREGDHFVQGWYEDEESFAAKLNLARRFNLQGVCLWVLDGVKEPPETYRLLREHLRGEIPAGRHGNHDR